MDLSQLEYFTTVVEEKTITKAADKLHITQPALSRAIMRMEENIGIPLFNRNGKQVLVNYWGKVIYDWAKSCQISYQDILDKIAEDTERHQTTLNIGLSGYTYSQMLLSGFHTLFPDIQVNEFRFSRYEFPEVFNSPSTDCIISTKKFNATGVESKLISRSPLFAALPKNHPLADKEKISFAEFAKERLVISSGNSLFVEHLEKLYQKIGTKMKVENKLDPIHLVRRVGKGEAMTIFSVEAVNSFPELWTNCVFIPFEEDFCYVEVYLLWLTREKYSEPFECFLEWADEYRHSLHGLSVVE